VQPEGDHVKRIRAAAAFAVLAVIGATILVGALPAAADGTTSVAVSCSGIPVVGTLSTSVSVVGTDSADPVASGGNVTDTISIPIPVNGSSLPVTVTVKEVDVLLPIPAGVTVNNVTFTSSSFSGQTFSVSGSTLTIKLTGSIPVGPSSPTPTVPAISIATTVTGAHRIVSWTVPTKITASASAGLLGNVTATCTPTTPSTVLISTEVGTRPVATAQSVTTLENTAKAITLAGTDADGDSLTAEVATQPAHGTLSGTAPNLTYTPTTGYFGADSFTFAENDGHATSTTATVSITVNKPYTPPVATPQTLTTAKNKALPIVLAGTDSNSAPLTDTVVTQPTHGVLSGTAPNLTYTPTAGFTGSDSFTFKVNDGVSDSPAATISISVTDTAPVATPQLVSTTKNVALPIVLAGTDADGDALTTSVVTQPAHGVLTGTAPNLTYTPASGYLGADSFTFKVNDGTLNSAAATVSITVTAPGAPTATPQSLVVAANSPLSITLAGTDTDGDPLTAAIAGQPTNGGITGTPPNVIYTPHADFTGTDSFTFTVADGALVSAPAAVSITVNAGVPGPPTIGSVVPGSTEATVTWTAPVLTGGSPITGYTVTPYIGNAAQTAVPFASTTTTQTVTGLTNAKGYTFKVAATNLVGTGPQSAASAKATPNLCAPFTTCGAAVTFSYKAMLGVAATTSQVVTDAAKLNAGTITLPAYIAAFRTSADHVNNVDPVTRLYQAYFLRIPDSGGLTYWIAQRRAGKTIQAISEFFANSSEFKHTYGSLSNQAFVELVYQNVLGRPGDAGGISFWTSQLNTKARDRGEVMVGFSESSEYKRTQGAAVNTSVAYILLLGRAPTTAEFNAAVTELNASTSVSTLIQQLMRTTEFATHIA
jgi:hypothetical protein